MSQEAGRPQAQRWEIALACAALLGAALFSVCDWSLWHPGFNDYDEEIEVIRMQLFREGYALPWVAFRGCLGRLAMALSCSSLGPSLSSMHVPVLLGFIVECCLLAAVAQRIFSQRAGAWAVIVNCLCAFSLMRARSLLMYAFLPLEWLAMILLLPRAGKNWAAFAWGLAASALLLDYEAWTLGLIFLALAFWLEHRGKAALAWALGGMGLGSCLVLAASWKILAGHLALRLAMTVPTGGGDLASSAMASLKSFWLGGHYLYFLAADGQPAFPAWALPLLLLGLGLAWKRWRSGLAWIALGFLPFLLARDSAAEPQRAMLAWPALCLFAGAGAEALLAWRPRLGAIFLSLLCLGGAAVEGRSYLESIHAHYALTYGDSANLLAMARELKATETGPRRFITELNHKSGAPIRFLFSSLKQSPQSSEVVAVLPWEYGPALKADWGPRLRAESAVSEAYSPPWLLWPKPDKAKRLDGIEAELRPLWSRAYLDGTYQVGKEALAYLDAHPRADPWVRTACWEGFLDSAMIQRSIDRKRVSQAMQEPLCSATFYEWMAAVSLVQDSDPRQPLRYAAAALKLDPGRANAQALFRQAQQRARQAP